MALRWVTTIGLLCLALLLAPQAAEACGGDGERACCNGCGEYSDAGTACNSGNIIFGTSTELQCGGSIICQAFKTKDICRAPKPCGGPGQRACCFLEDGRSNSCNAGLVEGPGCSVGDPNCVCKGGAYALGVCTAPTCGGPGQRGCCIGERSAKGISGPCSAGLLELGSCSAENPSGGCACVQPSGSNSLGVCVDPGCGGPGQRGCCVGAERTVKGLTSPDRPCATGLVEFGSCTGGDCACKSPAGSSSSGRCIAPTACGGEGQRACCSGEGTTCQPGLVETNTSLANLFGFSSESCSSQLGANACVCSSGAVSAGVCKRVHCGGDGERGCCIGNERSARGISGPCVAGAIEDTIAGCSGPDCACTGALAVGSSIGICQAVTACGGADQRACCVGLAEFPSHPGVAPDSLSCNTGMIEIAGCTGDDCYCGGLGTGQKSAGTCRENTHPTPCGGDGQRACCASTFEVLLGKACNAGKVEVPGCGGESCVCGGFNPFGIQASGTCVTPTPCGGAGQRACCTGTLEAQTDCKSGLQAIDGCSGDCFCGGPTATGQISSRSCTEPVLNSDGSFKSLKTISEPETGWTQPSEGPVCRMRGYADMHLHMFAEMAHGGGVLAGKAWDAGGINEALKQDYGTNLDLVSKTNIQNHTTTEVPAPGSGCPVELGDCGLKRLHGDHLLDDIVGAFSGDNSNSNLGAPLFNGWPRWSNVTHQQAYYKWLERAWRGGLRLVSMLAVTNEALCLGNKKLRDTDCDNSMKPLDAQIQAAKDFQAWLDTQSGGPGNGWFRIVTSSAEARNVIGQGKLAVVLGIEVDNLFNCKADATNQGLWTKSWAWDRTSRTWVRPNTPFCDADYVREEVQRYKAMGVVQVFPIHNFDNAYGATATWYDSINVGNRVSEGFYYTPEDCSNLFYGFQLSSAMTGIIAKLGFAGLEDPPNYSSFVATCNSRSLTSLGSALIDELMKQQMIIDVDHMGNKALDQVLTLAENYQPAGPRPQCSLDFQCTPGVCCPFGTEHGGTCAPSQAACNPSGHGYPVIASHIIPFDLTEQGARNERMRRDDQLARIKALGGMVAPITEMRDSDQTTLIGFPPAVSVQYGAVANDCRKSTKTFAQVFEKTVDVMGGPVGIGTDFNGTAWHLSPRFGNEACAGIPAERSGQYRANNRLVYPFTADAFGTFGKQQTGEKTYDYNVDGLAHVGLLPDFVADLKQVGLPDAALEMLWQSAEGFVDVWERAEGGASVPSLARSGGQCTGLQVNGGPIQIPVDAQCQVSGATIGQLAAADGRLATTVSPAGPFGSRYEALSGVIACVTVDAVDSCTASGAADSCTGCVRLVDKTPPALNCPANVTATSTGASTHPAIPDVTVSDNCATQFSSNDFGGAFFRCDHNPAAGFPLGTTTVTCSASDDFRNLSSCSYTVTITPFHAASQTITFGPLSDRAYGDGPFALSATASSGLPVVFSLVSGPATLSANTVSITGAGTVIIQASQPGNGSYEEAPGVTRSFDVVPGAITVVADAKSKTYGDPDPVLTYSVASGSLAFPGDGFTGALGRAAGEDVGAYAIQQGSLSLGGNYALTLVGADLTIGARALTVAADAQSKTYGESDPALTYHVSSGNLAFPGDGFTGSLARVAGEDVAAYSIQQGSLALGGNYALGFTGASLTIGAKALTITANNRSKTYGETVVFASTDFTTSGLINGDTVAGVSLNSAGAPAGAIVGTYAIVPSAAVGSGLANYATTYHDGQLMVDKAVPVLTWASALSGTYNQPATLIATLVFGPTSAIAGTIIPGQTVRLVVGAQSCTGVTQVTSGEATCTLTINQPQGTYPALATFAGDYNFRPVSVEAPFAVALDPTTTVYTGATKGDYLGTYTLSALVTETSSGLPAAGGTIAHFSLGQPVELQGCSGTVDPTGNASCSIQIQQTAGTYPVVATALGNNYYDASSSSATFDVSADTTLVRYTGPTLIANGRPVTVSARFTDTFTNQAVAGLEIAFALGAQGCSGITDIDGRASCTISTVAQPLGPTSIASSFAGNGYYLATSASTSVLVFAHPSGGGSFVIGKNAAGVGRAVTFWGSQWATINLPSAPSSFKGFAAMPALPVCGTGFSTSTGSSSNPPATVPAYMAVIATTSVTTSGSTMSGDSPIIVIVKTAPGYAPSPGHDGTGTVVAILCGGPPGAAH